MTEQEFEDKFDRGELDAEFAMHISEHYDAWSKAKMLSYWDDPDAYMDFKDHMVTVVAEKPQYSLGDNPLDNFPTIWSKK